MPRTTGAHGLDSLGRPRSPWRCIGTLPAVIGPLCGDGPVGKMDPGGLLGLLLDPLVVLPYPGLLFLQDEVDA